MSAPTGGAPEAEALHDPALAKLRGVGGWLSWFLLSCFLGPFVIVGMTWDAWSKLSAGEMRTLVTLTPLFGVDKGFELTGAVIVAVALFAAGLAIAQKRPYAALLAVAVLTLLISFYVADLVLTEWTLGNLRRELLSRGRAMSSDSSVELVKEVRSLLASILWQWYFLRSKRVQATFGPVTLRRVGAWLARRPLEARL
jgi:hypothetical protein